MIHHKNLFRKVFIKYNPDVAVDSVVPHTMISAGSGHGKDMLGERLITQKIGKYKVIDFYSESREEGFFYGLENDNNFFKDMIDTYSNRTLEPRTFKSEIYMIMGKKIKLYNEPPKNIKVITFDEIDFRGEPVIEFLAGNSNPSREVLTMMFWILRERYKITEPTLSDIEEEIVRIRLDLMKPKNEQTYIRQNYQQLHYMTIGNIYRNIIKIRESGIFEKAEDMGYEKIPIEKVLSDPETITTFSLQLLENDMQKALALGLIAKKTIDCKKENKDLPQVLMYMREIQKFYEKRDDGIEKYFSVLRNSIYYILTEGRDTGIILYGNSQDFFEQIPSYVATHFQQLIVGRQSKKSAEKLLNWAHIPTDIIYKLTKLDKGIFMYISMGNYYYPIFSPPTLHKKKEAGFHVMQHLINKHGSRTWPTEGLFSTYTLSSHSETSESPQNDLAPF